jgi:hypothetical protein
MARLLSGVAMLRYCGAKRQRKGGESALAPAFAGFPSPYP